MDKPNLGDILQRASFQRSTVDDALQKVVVSKLDTDQEQIQYIDLSLLDNDPRNFYELNGLEDLARNIELLGLQQPIRVRSHPEYPGRYIIVSGHRRRAALQMLVDDGLTQYCSVPCIQERGEGSELLQELRLIYANSDTRKMSSWEISRQTERVEELLYGMKESGYEFQGRMRDHIAQVCKISASKLARLKVIQQNLDETIKPLWKSGQLSESVAYRIAQEPLDVQTALVGSCGQDTVCKYTADQIGQTIASLNQPKTASPDKQDAAKQDELFLDFMRLYGFDDLIKSLDGAASRKDGIEALKVKNGKIHRGYCSSSFEWHCSPTSFAIGEDLSHMVERSWTQTWEAMAIVALERAVEKHTEEWESRYGQA